jgi:hypothetical protein
MVDVILADELIAAVRVAPVELHFALGQRHAEVRSLRVFEFHQIHAPGPSIERR